MEKAIQQLLFTSYDPILSHLNSDFENKGQACSYFLPQQMCSSSYF